jgi:hypothetical protein
VFLINEENIELRRHITMLIFAVPAPIDAPATHHLAHCT